MRFFSVIIPMYNREKLIGRAIRSCLNQVFADFEVIVVDDGSTDKSVETVLEFTDPRIRLIRHETNQERLIARNTGAKAARGQWLIWLDSDDELVPGALAVIKKRAGELPPDVLGMRFRCRLDSGRISPDPPYCDEEWDYETFIRWIESHHSKLGETLPVVHRRTTSTVLFPADKFYTGEMQYHLDFAAKYKIRSYTDILRIYHRDAYNNTSSSSVEKRLISAPAVASRLESVIASHGEGLIKWAPRTYYRTVGGIITQHLISGHRQKAFRVFLRTMVITPFRPKIWAIFAIGIIDQRLLAYAMTYKDKIAIEAGRSQSR